jgi:hypothetical protein
VEQFNAKASFTKERHSRWFSISRPSMSGKSKAKKKPLDEKDLALLKGKRVLICEDNVLNQEISKRLLEKKDIRFY